MLKFNFLLAFFLILFSVNLYANKYYDDGISLSGNDLLDFTRNIHHETDLDPLIPEIICENKLIQTLDCYAYNVVLNAVVNDVWWNPKKYTWKYVVIDLSSNEAVQYSYNYEPKPLQGVSGDKSFDKLEKVKVSRLKFILPLEKGKYKVTWTAEDSKGNILTKDQFVTVKDKTPPRPKIVDYALIKLENNMYEMKAKSLDKGGCGDGCISSFDNCTPQSELYFTFTPALPKLSENPEMWQSYYDLHGFYSFDPSTGDFVNDTLEYNLYRYGKVHRWWKELNSSSKTWTIDDGNAIIARVYVWDQFALNESQDDNNYNYEEVNIQLETPWWGPKIHGNVPVNLTMVMEAYYEKGFYATTSENGYYAIEVYPNTTYDVSGYSDDNMMCGISTLDLVYIQKYILGLYEIKDLYSYIAADADGDCEIKPHDILTLRKMILFPEEFFTHSYVAVNPDYEIKDSIPNAVDCKGAKVRIIKVDDLNVYGANFSAVKIGDVNLNCNNIEPRNALKEDFIVESSDFQSGDRVVVPIYSKDFNEVSGFQLTMSMTGLEFKEITDGEIQIEDSEYSIRDGHLIMSVARVHELSIEDGKVLFYLVFEATSDGRLNESLQINDIILRSEIYKGSDLTISKLDFSFKSSSAGLYQNMPNPFSEYTSIGFNLPENDKFDISITDLTGKVIRTIDGYGVKGYNYVSIHKNDFPGNFTVGIYTLKTGEFVASKKMILLH